MAYHVVWANIMVKITMVYHGFFGIVIPWHKNFTRWYTTLKIYHGTLYGGFWCGIYHGLPCGITILTNHVVYRGNFFIVYHGVFFSRVARHLQSSLNPVNVVVDKEITQAGRWLIYEWNLVICSDTESRGRYWRITTDHVSKYRRMATRRS